jgi:hypothetical protein
MPLVAPLAANVTVDSTTWAALALVLTILGAAYSWIAYRRRGLASGLRGLAWTLLPVAAWLTGTLKLAANILNDVIDWAARLVFSPTVWLGIIVAGVAVVLWFVSGMLLARGVGVRDRADRPAPVEGGRAKQVPGPSGRTAGTTPSKRSAPKKDDLDDMDEIEAILKRHGI